jgi:putative methionine-R-sulfoxide reductase with GAF domain
MTTDGILRRGCGDSESYAALRRRALELSVRHADPSDRLGPLCDALWDALAPRGLSWIGFYLDDPGQPASQPGGQMLLAARRDKPACSPIGLHGVCGQGYLEEVALLGAGYIACDPRDRSEIVIPIYRASHRWGVLDADSHEVACFGRPDIAGLCGVLQAAGLLERDLPVRADRLRERGNAV